MNSIIKSKQSTAANTAKPQSIDPARFWQGGNDLPHLSKRINASPPIKPCFVELKELADKQFDREWYEFLSFITGQAKQIPMVIQNRQQQALETANSE